MNANLIEILNIAITLLHYKLTGELPSNLLFISSFLLLLFQICDALGQHSILLLQRVDFTSLLDLRGAKLLGNGGKRGHGLLLLGQHWDCRRLFFLIAVCPEERVELALPQGLKLCMHLLVAILGLLRGHFRSDFVTDLLVSLELGGDSLKGRGVLWVRSGLHNVLNRFLIGRLCGLEGARHIDKVSHDAMASERLLVQFLSTGHAHTIVSLLSDCVLAPVISCLGRSELLGTTGGAGLLMVEELGGLLGCGRVDVVVEASIAITSRRVLLDSALLPHDGVL